MKFVQYKTTKKKTKSIKVPANCPIPIVDNRRFLEIFYYLVYHCRRHRPSTPKNVFCSIVLTVDAQQYPF